MFWKLCLRHYTTKSNEVVIAAALRTPLHGFPNSKKEIIMSQLRTEVIDNVIKQSALPKEVIDSVYVVDSKIVDSVESELLKKDITLSSFKSGIEALRNAIDEIKSGKAKSIILAATELLSTCSFRNEAIERLRLNVSKGLFDAETIPIKIRGKERRMETIVQDVHTFLEGNTRICMATALALTTNNIAILQNIKPLTSLLISEPSSSQDNSKLLQRFLETCGLNIKDVHRWELLSGSNLDISMSLKSNIACVYRNSIPEIFNEPIDTGGLLLLTHLAHSVKLMKVGCTLVQESSGSNAAFLLKNSNSLDNSLPVLKLYTKKLCPLCDELVEELENGFKNEYRLQKVFIDQKENVKYLRLYRYDIPVLFFNDQYLCMHRLNSTLLRRKLDEYRNSINENTNS